VSNQDRRPVDRPESANTTSTQMLIGAGCGDPNSQHNMVRLYAPLVLCWCRQGFPPWQHKIPPLTGVPAHDAADVVHEVFMTVFKKIKTFTKDGQPAAFRRWLYAITRYKVLEYWGDPARKFDGRGGSTSLIDNIPDPDPIPDDSSGSPPKDCLREVAEDGVSVRVLLRRILELIRPKFGSTWDAFWEYAVEGRPAEDVAKELGIKRGAVYTAKSRVLKRLREEAEALGFCFPEGNMVTATSPLPHSAR
jgi:RNA polymerase sigma-70 factor (ECF subfamily)